MPDIRSVNTTPSLDGPAIPDITEGVELTRDSLYAGISEEDFNQAVAERLQRATEYWAKFGLDQKRERNAKYWMGDQVDRTQIRADLEKGVDNIIFRNIETFIPIATSRTPEPTFTPRYKNEETRAYASDIRRALRSEWSILQSMQPLVGRAIRNHQINRIGVIKYGYDPDTEEFWSEEVSATDIVVSPTGDFVGHWIRNKTLGDLLEMYPNKKGVILKHFNHSEEIEPTKKILASPVTYLECWTNDYVGVRLDTIMLGVEDNPHFDYTGKEIEVDSGQLDPVTGGPVMVKKKIKYNHFKTPKMPFLFLVYWNRGLHVIDDTTLLEQAIGAQDWVNKRKRQIGANADSTNGHWVSSGDYISKEEFALIQGGVDEKIWLEKGLPNDGLIKITGAELPSYIYQDLQDSRSAIDNLMGVHSTTRGEKSGAGTATQDLMSRDQDYGRVDGYVRDGIEQLARKWFEAMYHMYLVYHTDEIQIPVPEDDDFETDNIAFSRDRVPLIETSKGELIPVPLLISVQQGSTMPQDEVAEAIKAEKSKDVLSPLDYFRLSGYSNPRELTKNFLMWQNDPFSFFQNDPDVQAMLQRKQAEAAAAAQQALGMPGDPAAMGGAMPAQGDAGTEKGIGNAMRAIIEGQVQQ